MLKKNSNNIRLRPWEIKGIVQGIEEVSQKKNLSLKGAALYLYGSRTHPERRGGDIDLVLEVPEDQLKSFQELKIRILVMIKEKIGDQKIDLLIRDKTTPWNTFETLAFKKRSQMKEW